MIFVIRDVSLILLLVNYGAISQFSGPVAHVGQAQVQVTTVPVTGTPEPTETPISTSVSTPTLQSTVSLSTATPSSTRPSILDYVTAFGTIATPVVVLILTGLGWSIRKRIDRVQELEEKLREDRIKIYNDILEPFIILLTKAEGLPNTREYKGKTNIEAGSKKALSLEYKQTAFKLSLIGSDEVLRSFNNLMQFFYNDDAKEKSKEFMVLFGTLLLEIRKSVGNQDTALQPLEMLEFLITDIKKYQ